MAQAQVLFVNSPSREYDPVHNQKTNGERGLTPLGLALVASDTETKLGSGSVAFLDAEYLGMSVLQICEHVGKTFPNGEGWFAANIMTPCFVPTIRMVKAVAAAFPELKLLLGGPHAIMDPTSILEHIPQAIVVRGEGEVVAARIIKGEPLEGIPGAAWKPNGVVMQRGANAISDINTVPWINRKLLQNEPYTKAGFKTMASLSTRGCACNCSFCITPAERIVMNANSQVEVLKVRFRHIDDVMDEVAYLVNEFGIEHVQFLDDECLPSPKRAMEFAESWERHGLVGKIDFHALMRPNKTAQMGQLGILKDLKRVGFKVTSAGIETGYDRARIMVSGRNGKLDPKYDPNNVRAAIRYCAEAGVNIKGFFMFGFPGETKEETQQTLDFMYSLRGDGLDRIAIYVVKPYPGTGLYDEALKLPGITPELLGHYASGDVKAQIESGVDPRLASRDIYFPTVQLAELPPEELQELAVYHMAQYNKDRMEDARIDAANRAEHDCTV